MLFGRFRETAQPVATTMIVAAISPALIRLTLPSFAAWSWKNGERDREPGRAEAGEHARRFPDQQHQDDDVVLRHQTFTCWNASDTVEPLGTCVPGGGFWLATS